MLLMIFVAPKHGHKNIIVYISICSTLGSFTVMACKGVGTAIKETFHGKNEFTNWLTWILLIIVVSCILVQLNYLNKALDTFNTAVVTPIYYVFFTSFVILASVILFKEWGKMSAVDITGNMCGFLTIICGIFLLQAFKDMNISLANLPKAKKEEPTLNGDAMSAHINQDDEIGLLDENMIDDGDSLQMQVDYRDDAHLVTEYHDDDFRTDFRP